MTRINHERILQDFIAKYEMENGEPGLAKAEVDDLVYKLGGNQGDIFKVRALGMEHFFGDVMDGSGLLN